MSKAQAKMNDPKAALEFFRSKVAFTTGPIELESMLKNDQPVNVVDVRAARHFEEAHIPGSVNLPEEEWNTYRGLQKDRLNVVLCYEEVCHLAARACGHFAAAGFSVMELQGGFKTWKDHELKVVSGAAV